MGLTIIYENIEGSPRDNFDIIKQVVKEYYSKHYVVDQTMLNNWKLLKSEGGGYVATWSRLPHSEHFFLASSYAFNTYLEKFMVYLNATIDSKYTENGVTTITKFEYYMNKCVFHYKNCEPRMNHIRNMPYFYIISMLYLYKYYVESGVEITDQHTSIILSCLAQQAKSVCLYDTILKIFEPEFKNTDVMINFKLSGDTISTMMLESILKSYDGTPKEMIFNYFKGIYIVKYFMMYESTETSGKYLQTYTAQLIADLLRFQYATIGDTSLRLKYFTNGWKGLDSNTMLINAINAFDNFVYDVVHQVYAESIGYDYDLFKQNVNEVYSLVERMPVSKVKSALCVDNFVIMKSEYNRVLSFKDIAFDLNLMKVRDHYPHDISDNSIRYNFNVPANAHRQMMLDKFMSDLFDEPEIIHYMYVIFGRALRGNVLDKAFWVFIGHSNAGKSKFAEMVSKAFGDYATTLSGDILNKQSSNSASATPDVNLMVGSLVGFVQEPRRGRVDIEAIKERTGDEKMYVRELYCEGRVVKNTMRMFSVANQMYFNTHDEAFWRRCKVVKFKRKFVKSDEYDNLAETLSPEKMASEYRVGAENIDTIIDYIAPEFMIRCINQYYNTLYMPLIDPPLVKQYINEFRLENDNVYLFVNTAYEVTKDTSDTVNVQFAYDRYKDWFDERTADSRNLLTMSMFKDGVRSAGLAIDDELILGLKDRVNVKFIAGSMPMFRHRTIEYKNSLSENFDVESAVRVLEN